MDRRTFIRSSLTAAMATSMPGAYAFTQPLLHAPTKVAGDIDALTSDGKQVTLKQAALQELSDSLKGKLLLPTTKGYESARWLLNSKYDKYPAA